MSRFDSSAYSCLQLRRAVSHSVGAHTESLQPRDHDSSSSSSSSKDEDEASQAPVPTVTTSVPSESATAADEPTSDDCCELCLVAPRAGFALVPCGHARNLVLCVCQIWNSETRLSMSTLVIWSRFVQSRDVRSRVFSRPGCSFLRMKLSIATAPDVSYFHIVQSGPTISGPTISCLAVCSAIFKSFIFRPPLKVKYSTRDVLRHKLVSAICEYVIWVTNV